jgi:hypothetical protein
MLEITCLKDTMMDLEEEEENMEQLFKPNFSPTFFFFPFTKETIVKYIFTSLKK